MRKTLLLLLLTAVFCGAFARKTPQVAPAPQVPDSLRGFYLFTEGIKQAFIERDTAAARASLERSVEADSTYGPHGTNWPNCCFTTMLPPPCAMPNAPSAPTRPTNGTCCNWGRRRFSTTATAMRSAPTTGCARSTHRIPTPTACWRCSTTRRGNPSRRSPCSIRRRCVSAGSTPCRNSNAACWWEPANTTAP